LISIESIIAAEMAKVAEQYSKQLVPLDGSTKLLESGLDSLCFAVLVMRLEERLGTDPFSNAEDTGFPTTFGDLVRTYEDAAQ
jgi:acyl carrier protein